MNFYNSNVLGFKRWFDVVMCNFRNVCREENILLCYGGVYFRVKD